MSTGRVCVRTVQVAAPDEPLREAVRRMREADVGTLVVVDEQGRPAGVLAPDDVVDLLIEEAEAIGRLLRR